MSVHYKQPVLLIEFEEHKSFSLEASIQVSWPIRCWATTLHILNSTYIGTIIQVTNVPASQARLYLFDHYVLRRAIIDRGRSLSGLRVVSWLKLGKVLLAL